jgi:hypothetical protein
MTALIAQSTGIQRLDVALGVLTDDNSTVDDKAAAYAFLHQVQLRINRKLKLAKDELIVHMERTGLRDMGPLSVKSSSIDPRWVCNDEGNWDDAGVQDAMAVLAQIAPDYIRHVPEHYEIKTAELGAGIGAGDPLALELLRECKARGWRTEEGRRLSLAVKEPKL